MNLLGIAVHVTLKEDSMAVKEQEETVRSKVDSSQKEIGKGVKYTLHANTCD